MDCLEQVFIHDGLGHLIYFQTFNGHADLGKNALRMMDRISEYLRNTTTLEGQFTVNRILILDGAGNGVKTLRELSESGYFFIIMLDSNQSMIGRSSPYQKRRDTITVMPIWWIVSRSRRIPTITVTNSR